MSPQIVYRSSWYTQCMSGSICTLYTHFMYRIQLYTVQNTNKQKKNRNQSKLYLMPYHAFISILLKRDDLKGIYMIHLLKCKENLIYQHL